MKYILRYEYVLEVEVEAEDRDEAADIAAEVDMAANNPGNPKVLSTDVQYILLTSIEATEQA